MQPSCIGQRSRAPVPIHLLSYGRMHPIIGFLGPSGAGKTTLMFGLLASDPERYGLVTSLTTRPSRGAEDEKVFRFTTHDEIRRMERDGELFQVSEYAGNLYANDHASVDALLETKIGLMAIVEMGVRNFRDAGYRVILVRVVPEGEPMIQGRPAPDAIRRMEDARRAAESLPADLTIVNSFAPGGKERALEELLSFASTIDDK